jgi:hypothetical protein
MLNWITSNYYIQPFSDFEATVAVYYSHFHDFQKWSHDCVKNEQPVLVWILKASIWCWPVCAGLFVLLVYCRHWIFCNPRDISKFSSHNPASYTGALRLWLSANNRFVDNNCDDKQFSYIYLELGWSWVTFTHPFPPVHIPAQQDSKDVITDMCFKYTRYCVRFSSIYIHL